ncbi:MAG: hypothetical protein OQL16_09960 [Gammaproteobacteria bacterium]|nr:hypothetical protein [Gammaproteobacteria bacterium]
MARVRVKGRFLRTKWWSGTDKTRTAAEQGSALAFIAWRVAHETAITLHGEDFVYRDDGQRLDVIAEFLAFIVHLVDRIAYEQLPEEIRNELINALGSKLAEHMEDNRMDWQGPGDHRTPLINLFNQRFGEYAEEGFDTDSGPKYSMYRHVGHCVQEHMSDDQEHGNRWVIDQVMDVEGPEIYKKIDNAMQNLLDTGSIDLTPPTELEDDVYVPKPGQGVVGEET